MKFYCDNCQTKYSIADSKVAGKVLKVRCKKCSHVITVRQPKSPVEPVQPSPRGSASAPGSSKAAPPPPPSQQTQWHYSVNGQSYGPLEQRALQKKLATGELGGATYVWKENFGDWKSVKDVDVFAGALQKAHAKKKPNDTIGISQPMEAINQDDYGAKEQQKDEESSRSSALESAGGGDSKPTPKPKPKPQKDKKSSISDQIRHSQKDAGDETSTTGEAQTGKKGQQDRLEKLRERLRLGDGDETRTEQQEETGTASKTEDDGPQLGLDAKAGPRESDADSETTDGDRKQPEIASESEQAVELRDSSTPEIGEGGSDFGMGHADTLPEGVGDDDGEDGQEASVHDGLFSGADSGGLPSDPARTPESDRPGEDDGEDADDADDAVPFFPSAPKLGSSGDESDKSTSMSRVDEVTGSLLIQINEIKSDGRKRAIVATIGALVALLVVGAVSYVGWTQMGADEVEEERPRIGAGNVGAQPEFREYSQEELARVSNVMVLEEELVISREDGKAAYEREQARESGGRAATDEAPAAESGSSRPSPSIDPESFRFDDDDPDLMEGSRAGDDSPGPSGPRFARAGSDSSGASTDDDFAGLASGSDSDSQGGSDRFDALSAVQSDTQRELYQGDGSLDMNRPELQEGLTGHQIADGVERVMESIGSCRERHIFRGGSLDENQVHVILTIVPRGSVEKFEMKPESLDGTDFERCMNSHTRRWRFARFKGDPVQIEMPFSLQ